MEYFHEMQLEVSEYAKYVATWIANILHAYPSPIALGDGSKLTFSEHGHVAYQIKGNHNLPTTW